MDIIKFNDTSEATIEDEDYIDDTAFDSEICGICTDVVIDRGVLDCCSHWFCFGCIDNWAAITNLCPLCKSEFQLITCLPVYDTIGNIKMEEHSFPRDDDWCVQGNNNTLSFPSYYIDEDAVICLDGDGCKIRSGLAAFEEDSTLDTSIACDSCDIWYHAFCVGFNPEHTVENSWLCPRCITNGVEQKSDEVSMQNLGKHSPLTNADLGWIIDPSFSGKVSVSVADAGETAVVVSMFEGKQMIEASKNSSDLKLDFNTQDKIEASARNAVVGNEKFDVQLDKSSWDELMWSDLICSDEKGSIANASQHTNTSEILLDMSPVVAGGESLQVDVKLEVNSLSIPSLQDTSSEMAVLPPCKDMMETTSPLSLCLATHGDSKANSTEKIKHHPCDFDGYRISCSPSIETSANMNGLSEDDSTINLPRDIPVVSSFPVDKEVDGATKDHMVTANGLCPSELSSLPDTMMVTSAHEETTDVTDQENFEAVGGKHTKKFPSYAIDLDLVNNYTKKRERGLQVKIEADCHAKKTKSEGKSQISPSRCKINTSVSGKSQRCSRTTASTKDVNLSHGPQKQVMGTDISSIVQETGHRSNSSSTGKKSVSITSDERDNAIGLRVKKIMRRAGDRKESSILVQKLRKEIKEVVQDKISNNIDKVSGFDAKLLTAFRAAIVKPRVELVNKFDPSLIRARKSLLQKGKIRENLTKKIYASSTGRRRRAWDRDRQIEFWRHRCKRMKPEKVETLQSVLEFLKKATSSCSENLEMDQGPEGVTKNSVLSRVYLADASVFPRKDDIQPLSALVGHSMNDNLERGKESDSRSKKDSQTVHGSNMAKSPSGVSNVSSLVSTSDSTGKKSFTSREASFRQGNLDCLRSGPSSISGSISSRRKEQNLKEPDSQSNSPKSDKRKWALEVLARKDALMNLNACQENKEDNAELKGKYPLLAQLPTDMRPALAPSRHNKVPVSVRQTQLYRITEHYLRKANLAVIHRTANTELAVADAVNVEKDIFERSDSKLVYRNLCSQFLSQLAKKTKSAECDSLLATSVGTDQAGEEASPEPPGIGCSKVEEALKLAGLSDSPLNLVGTSVGTDQAVEEALKLAGLSDSPTTSPCRPLKDANEHDHTRIDASGEALENVLDIDSHPELDIYGDFEYDLDDESYTAPSSIASALDVLKIQPENGDSRMKVVLSTLKHDPPEPQSSEAIGDDRDKVRESELPSEPPPSVEVRTSVPLFLEPSQGEIYKEPSLAECEELYGPEKEPLVNRIASDEVIGEPSNVEMDAVADDKAENYRLKDGATVSAFEAEGCAENFISDTAPLHHESHGVGNSLSRSLTSENMSKEEGAKIAIDKKSISSHFISKKVEAYVKEHIRPLCKSGVITVEQYRWAVGKTKDKVMKYHHNAKNANFLIKEGEKVKKLAEQYVEAAPQKKRD